MPISGQLRQNLDLSEQELSKCIPVQPHRDARLYCGCCMRSKGHLDIGTLGKACLPSLRSFIPLMLLLEPRADLLKMTKRTGF